MKVILIITFSALFLVLSSCDSVRKGDHKIKKDYSTKFCKKGKKLWAKSFLGQKAPEFSVEGWISSKPDFKDKFILIDFWGVYCPQCKKAIPELNEMSKKYKDKLVVVGVAENSKEIVMSMKTPKIEYYSAYDTKEVLKKQYEVEGIPHLVIVAPNNKIVWEGFPFSSEDKLDLKKVGLIVNQ